MENKPKRITPNRFSKMAQGKHIEIKFGNYQTYLNSIQFSNDFLFNESEYTSLPMKHT